MKAKPSVKQSIHAPRESGTSDTSRSDEARRPVLRWQLPTSAGGETRIVNDKYSTVPLRVRRCSAIYGANLRGMSAFPSLRASSRRQHSTAENSVTKYMHIAKHKPNDSYAEQHGTRLYYSGTRGVRNETENTAQE